MQLFIDKMHVIEFIIDDRSPLYMKNYKEYK